MEFLLNRPTWFGKFFIYFVGKFSFRFVAVVSISCVAKETTATNPEKMPAERNSQGLMGLEFHFMELKGKEVPACEAAFGAAENRSRGF